MTIYVTENITCNELTMLESTCNCILMGDNRGILKLGTLFLIVPYILRDRVTSYSFGKQKLTGCTCLHILNISIIREIKQKAHKITYNTNRLQN